MRKRMSLTSQEDKDNARKAETGWANFLRRSLSFLLTLVLCFVLVFLITRFVLQHNTVIGSSMTPTLADQDEVFVEKLSRLFPSGLKRGDIVTADAYRDNTESDEIVIIKRVSCHGVPWGGGTADRIGSMSSGPSSCTRLTL